MGTVKLSTLIDYEKLSVIKRLEILKNPDGWTIFAVLSDGREVELETARGGVKIFKKFDSAIDEIEEILTTKVDRVKIR